MKILFALEPDVASHIDEKVVDGGLVSSGDIGVGVESLADILEETVGGFLSLEAHCRASLHEGVVEGQAISRRVGTGGVGGYEGVCTSLVQELLKLDLVLELNAECAIQALVENVSHDGVILPKALCGRA